jgi:hypothetical protein
MPTREFSMPTNGQYSPPGETAEAEARYYAQIDVFDIAA